MRSGPTLAGDVEQSQEPESLHLHLSMSHPSGSTSAYQVGAMYSFKHVHFRLNIFNLITIHTPINTQSSNFVGFCLQYV